MKQRKSICCLSAKGTNPCFGGGSISSLLVSATGTNKTTEPKKSTKNDNSSALVISWATEPGWVPHYISQDAFSSKKRISTGIFYRCRRKQFCKVYNTHKKIRMGHWRQSRVTVRARFQKHSGVAAAVLHRQCSRGWLSVLKSTKKQQRTHICNFQLLKEQFHPDKNSPELGLTHSFLAITSQENIIFKGVHESPNSLLMGLSHPQQQGQLSWSSPHRTANIL